MTLGFAGYVAYVGLSSKQDVQTLKTAQEIAPKLNTFVQNNQKIPTSLDEAGISDVPSTIKYTKASDVEYSFCVTYKEASGYNDYGLGQSLVGTALTGGATVYDDPSYYDSQYSPESLYVSEVHKKGENCQNVKPYFSNSYNPPAYNYNLPNGPEDSTSTNNDSADDRAREADINALHSQIEYYYGVNGYYPALANLNDKDFIAKNLIGLDSSALSDPDSSSTILVAKPQAKAYAYAVTPVGCDNDSKKCTGYTLTATKTDGKTIVKKSLN